jgi:tetratricopeptide (TPR) repeat protein
MPESKKKLSLRNGSSKRNSSKWLLLGAILILTLISFSSSLKNNFTNWDDDRYVIDNLMLSKPLNECAKFYFNNIFFNNYHPLTMMLYAFVYHHSEPVQNVIIDPESFHKINLLIHLINVSLVFWFIFLLSGKRLEVAAVCAMLFGIHPMHVESVVWVSELKDVLYSFFFIGGLIAYYKYINYSKRTSPKTGLYLLTFVFFILSGLSKPAAVTFTLMLPLIDFYCKRKFNAVVWLEKVPFLVISMVLGIITFKAQLPDSIGKIETFTLFQRLMFGCYSMLVYLYKLILPINLSALYPYPTLAGHELNLSFIFYAAPFIFALIFFLVYRSLKYSRIIVFGFLFFFLNIILVLQFLSVGNALVAERYSYVPYIGLFFIIGMGFSWLYRNTNPKIASYKSIFIGAVIIIGITFAYIANARCNVWYNSETLWTDVINKYPDNAEAYKNRGGYLTDKTKYDISPSKNDFDKAFEDFNTAIKLNPVDAKLYLDRANVYAEKGKYNLALTDYSSALKLDSSDYSIYLNRGITYSKMEKYDSAFVDWGMVMKQDVSGFQIQQIAKLIQTRAFTSLQAKKFKDAVDDYSWLINRDISVRPNIYFFRGIAYFEMKNYEASLTDNTKAIEMDPNYTEAYYNRSQVNFNLKLYKSSLDDILKAKSLGYDVDPAMIQEIQAAIHDSK